MAVVPGPADRGLDARLREHGRVSRRLASTSDEELSSLVAAGGEQAGFTIEVEGAAVFVKRLPLSDRERAAGAVGSTANLFGLPAHCHFGVGSPGFGAWRELAATAVASRWVQDRRAEHFVLLHHWRVLPGAPPSAAEFGDIDAAVAFWGEDPAMRARLEALAGASSSLVLFLEHIPQTVTGWLAAQSASTEASTSETPTTEAASAAVDLLEGQLLAGAGFMAAHGLVHFDAHYDNILTDGRRLYFADFGLAATPEFTLSADEAGLVERARTHDVAYVVARLVNWVVSTFGGLSGALDPVVRNEYVRGFARGASTAGFTDPAGRIVRRYAPLADIVNGFYAELLTVRRDVPYPAEAVEGELARLRVVGVLPTTDP